MADRTTVQANDMTHMIPIAQYNSLIDENKFLKNQVSALLNAETLRKNSEILRKIRDKDDASVKSMEDYRTKQQKLTQESINNQTLMQDTLINKRSFDENIATQKRDLADMRNTIDEMNKHNLFNKFAIAFQDINDKYHFDASTDSLFNSEDYNDAIFYGSFKGNYIFSGDHKFSDTAIIIYYKIELLRTELLKLTDDSIKSFEEIYGDGIIKEMLGHLDKILSDHKPDGDIPDKVIKRYSNYFQNY